jgi:broad specificity phosphatase PhoE
LSEPTLTLIRHGETGWSRSGQHTSYTELDLTLTGEEQARRVGAALAGAEFDLVLCSPRLRAVRTAELAGLVPFTIDDDLAEWDYGDLEGLTTPEIQQRYPGWSIWAGPWPGGETSAAVRDRADRLIGQVVAIGLPRVALIGHGHMGRVLAARWVGGEVPVGQWLELDTGTWSELGWYRGTRVLRRWNLPAAVSAPL